MYIYTHIYIKSLLKKKEKWMRGQGKTPKSGYFLNLIQLPPVCSSDLYQDCFYYSHPGFWLSNIINKQTHFLNLPCSFRVYHK